MKRSQKSSTRVPDEEAASANDVMAELASLSDEQCLRLQRYAQSRVGGLGRGSLSSDATALLSEAILATCDGDRRWHKTSVDFFGHLIGVIHSKSSHLHKKAASNKTYLESDVIAEGQAGSPIENSPSLSPNPEASLLAHEAVERIESAVAERPIGWMILEARREGMNRAEIIEEFQISGTEYDTNLRWLRRTVQKLQEGGS
jgi:DNA-directed RNA polymerase specialized sigma24 family protein